MQLKKKQKTVCLLPIIFTLCVSFCFCLHENWMDCNKYFSHNNKMPQVSRGKLLFSFWPESQSLLQLWKIPSQVSWTLDASAPLTFPPFYTHNAETTSSVNFFPLLSWWYNVLIRAKSSRERWEEVEDRRRDTAQRSAEPSDYSGDDAKHSVPPHWIRARREHTPNDSLQS